MEKRNRERAALRTFFSEQWNYLLGLIQDRSECSDEAPIDKQQLTDAVEQIVDKIDSRFRGVGSYQNQLRCAVHELLLYIEKLTDELPEAITLDRNSYIHEPLVNAIFASNDELKMLLNQSEELQNFAIGPKAEDEQAVYALLFAVREEKSIFGTEHVGDNIQRDVQQTAVNFRGQQIITPGRSEEAVRASLKEILFERVISAIRTDMVKLRHSQSPEALQQAALDPANNINNPETYLRLLTDKLAMPKEIIGHQRSTIRVSKMGIKLSAGAKDLSNGFSLNELKIGREQIKVVSIVKVVLTEWS